MKNKGLLIGGAIAIVVLVVLLLVIALGGPGSGNDVTLPDHEFESWDTPIENPEEATAQAMSIFDEDTPLTFSQIVDAARAGRISLVSELWRLRRKCPEDMERYQCNLLLRQWIMEKFPAPDNEQMVSLLINYLKYEEAMAGLRTPEDMTLEERYELIRQTRREIFGEDEAQLVFGLEEARFDFRQEFQRFNEETADMPGSQRMAAYERLRRQVYGDYYDAIVEREPPFDRYTMELTLRENDLESLESPARNQATREMRVRYFGPEAADRMEAVDRMLADENRRVAELERAEAEFLRNNAGLSQAEKDRRLYELRVEYLGPEEAEAYTRRQQLQAAGQN